MAENAGVSGDLIIHKIENETEPNAGWDFKTGKIVDMISSGIIDPSKVVSTAIQNAVSVTRLSKRAEACLKVSVINWR